MLGSRLAVYTFDVASGRLEPPSDIEELTRESTLLRLLLCEKHFYPVVPAADVANKRWASAIPAAALTLLTIDGKEMSVLGVGADGNCLFRAVPVVCDGYGLNWKQLATRFYYNEEEPAIHAGACNVSMMCSTIDRQNCKQIIPDGSYVVLDNSGHRVGIYAGHASQSGKKGFIAVIDQLPKMYEFVPVHDATVMHDDTEGSPTLFRASVELARVQLKQKCIAEATVDLTTTTDDTIRHLGTTELLQELHQRNIQGETLKKELKEARQELAQRRRKVNQLHTELQTLQNVAETKKKTPSTRAARRHAEEGTPTALQAKLVEAEKRATEAEKWATEAEKRATEAEERATKAEKRAVKAEKDRDVSDEQCVTTSELINEKEALQDDNLTQRKQRKEAYKKLEAKGVLLAEVRKQLRNEKKITDRLKKENETLQDFEDTVAEQRDEIESLRCEQKEQIDSLKHDHAEVVSSSETERANLSSSLDEIKKELTSCKTSNSELTSKLKNQNSIDMRVNDLSQSEKLLQTKIADLEGKLKEFGFLTDRYKSKYRKSKQIVAALQAETSKMADLQRQLTVATSSVKSLSTECKAQEESLKTKKSGARKDETRIRTHTRTHALCI